jgi:hypothetical protein
MFPAIGVALITTIPQHPQLPMGGACFSLLSPGSRAAYQISVAIRPKAIARR